MIYKRKVATLRAPLGKNEYYFDFGTLIKLKKGWRIESFVADYTFL